MIPVIEGDAKTVSASIECLFGKPFLSYVTSADETIAEAGCDLRVYRGTPAVA
jgi:hypothetical protein